MPKTERRSFSREFKRRRLPARHDPGLGVTRPTRAPTELSDPLGAGCSGARETLSIARVADAEWRHAATLGRET